MLTENDLLPAYSSLESKHYFLHAYISGYPNANSKLSNTAKIVEAITQKRGSKPY